MTCPRSRKVMRHQVTRSRPVDRNTLKDHHVRRRKHGGLEANAQLPTTAAPRGPRTPSASSSSDVSSASVAGYNESSRLTADGRRKKPPLRTVWRGLYSAFNGLCGLLQTVFIPPPEMHFPTTSPPPSSGKRKQQRLGPISLSLRIPDPNLGRIYHVSCSSSSLEE